MEGMRTKIMRLSDIQPAEYNPRIKLTERDYEYKALRESITQFGLVVPLIVNERTAKLVGGHQRLSVLMEQGVEETEVVVIDVDDAKEKAICIAMNKVTGQWDYGKLADIMEELRDTDIDTTMTGFSDGDIMELLGELDAADGDIPKVEGVAKKDDDTEGIPCIVGEYKFQIADAPYKDMMADVRKKVGFSKEMVADELKRRLMG